MNEIVCGRGLNKSESAINTVKLMLEHEILKQQHKILLEYAKCKYFGYRVSWVLRKQVGEVLERLRDR